MGTGVRRTFYFKSLSGMKKLAAEENTEGGKWQYFQRVVFGKFNQKIVTGETQNTTRYYYLIMLLF